jgi:hypothetical protein
LPPSANLYPARSSQTCLRVTWTGVANGTPRLAVCFHSEFSFAVRGVRGVVSSKDDDLEAGIGFAVRLSLVRSNGPIGFRSVVTRDLVEDNRTSRAWQKARIWIRWGCAASPLPYFSMPGVGVDVARVDGDAILEGRMIPWGTISVVEKRRDGLATVVDLLAWNDAYVNGTRRARCQ